MPTLPNTQGVDNLTVEEIQQGIAKMKPNKACGPDEIPIEVFQNCPSCMRLLSTLLFKIWRDEEVPAELAQATFVMLHKKDQPMIQPNIDVLQCLTMLTKHSRNAYWQELKKKLRNTFPNGRPDSGLAVAAVTMC